MCPILSIAIPTYGSPDAVKDNVTRLLACKRHDIEILVVDNDETGEQIKSWMLSVEDSRFHYHQNQQNIGRPDNIVKAVELAQSDNVLLLSSDDILCLDALDEVFKYIKLYPDFGVLIGTVITSQGRLGVPFGKPGVYEIGIDSLMQLPLFGNLVPMVVNRKYLNLQKLYHQDEAYMQLRIAIMALEYGRYIYFDTQLSYMLDNAEAHLNKEKYEPLEKGTLDISKWGKTTDFYSPKARGVQLKQYLELIDSYNLRLNQRIQLIDKWVTAYAGDTLYYVVVCQSPFMRSIHADLKLCGYEEALQIWKSELLPFFEKKEQEGTYCYTGRFEDVIKNERILLHQAEQIMECICKSEKLIIYGEGKIPKNLQTVLSFMKFVSELYNKKANIDGALVLVPFRYDHKIEDMLLTQGAEKVMFMERLEKYLSIVWCSGHQTPDNFNHYVAYID